MPNVSHRVKILQFLSATQVAIALKWKEEVTTSFESSDSDSQDEWSDISCDSSSIFSRTNSMVISPRSPHSPMFSASSMDVNSNSDDTISTVELISTPYQRVMRVIERLHEDVEAIQVLDRPGVLVPKFPQLQLLHHFAEHRPAQFRKKLRVDPHIFDDILEEISDHTIFQNRSNNKQLPISIQLAIFLFRAGHYGNACTPDDVAQWAGVSIGTVNNCTHRVMAALLDQHDQFIYIPDVHSEDMRKARAFAESRSCHAWRNGIFAADGSAINLHERPGMFSDGFYD